MTREEVEVLVVGGGQAGVAMSEHLGACGVPHLVLERHRIAERWRSERWDSLVANGPVWHDRFPGMEFLDLDPDAFASKEQVADYFVAYAEKIGAPDPLRRRGDVGAAATTAGRASACETSEGIIDARFVVAATGPFQRPVIPPIVPDAAVPLQIHSSAYRNPEQLPEGAVLVVGAGSSGVQIADELRRSGRRGPPLRRPARPAPAGVPRARLLLVARCPGHVGRGDPSARRRARHDRGQRSARRTHGRLPRPRRQRHPARRPHRRRSTTAPCASRRTSPTTSPTATPTTCRCSTPPTPTSSATASTSPRSRRPASWDPTRPA